MKEPVEVRDAGLEARDAFVVGPAVEFPLDEAGDIRVGQDHVHSLEVRPAQARGKQRAQVHLPQQGEPTVVMSFAPSP